MKRMISISLLVVAFVFAGTIFGCAKQAPPPPTTTAPKPITAPPPAKAQKITLKFASSYAPPHENAVTSQHFVKTVNERAKGELELVFYPEGILGKQNELLTLTGKGVVDMADIGGAGPTAPLVPESTITSAFTGMSLENSIKAMDAGVGALLNEAFMQKANVRWVYPRLGIVNNLFTTKTPLTKWDSIRGLKIRTPGGQGAVEVEALGGVSVNIASAEVTIALQRGTIEGARWISGSVYAAKAWEVLKYGLKDPALSTGGSFVLMNADVFNKLPAHLQKLLTDVAIEESTWSAKYMLDEVPTHWSEFEKYGSKANVLPPEEKARFVKAVSEAVDAWYLKTAGERGQKIVDVMKKFR